MITPFEKTWCDSFFKVGIIFHLSSCLLDKYATVLLPKGEDRGKDEHGKWRKLESESQVT